MARITLAVDRRFKQEGQPTADFINCLAFGKRAEFLEKYCQKGTKLVVGYVKECIEHPNSDHLHICQVETAPGEVRQIVSGIKAQFSPEDMVGKKVVVVTNLKPAKLAGVESQGMILCAEDAEGKLALVTAGEDMPHGAEIR